MKITIELLKNWNACLEGIAWANAHYPNGVEYDVAVAALIANGKDDWRIWLARTVAKHTTDESLLARLAGDESWYVRRAVAERTTDESLLARLAGDESWYVRLAATQQLLNMELKNAGG